MRKKAFEWDPPLDAGQGDWTANPALDLKFVYDGWLLLMELDGLNSDAVLRRYTWGLDLSGQSGSPGVGGLHGAGGIGGLLAIHDTAGTPSTSDDQNFVAFADANGNVGQLVDAGNGQTAAFYDYFDPYGGAAMAGAYAATNPFRFSTKYHDDESGLYYYGYRFYSLALGRWSTRDVLDAQDGANLSAYGRNAPTDYSDDDGRSAYRIRRQGVQPVGTPKPTSAGYVDVCCRDTNIGSSQDCIARLCGYKHCWLRASRYEAGMGPAGGQSVDQDSSPCCGTQTEIVDDRNKGENDGATCYRVPECNDRCVDAQLIIGTSLGAWTPFNNCNTFVTNTLANCGCKNQCTKLETVWFQFEGVPAGRKCVEWAVPPNLLPPPGEPPILGSP